MLEKAIEGVERYLMSIYMRLKNQESDDRDGDKTRFEGASASLSILESLD